MTPLVLAAHGSTDPRFAEVITSLAATVAAARPHLDVQVGFLEHGPPDFADVSRAGRVVVPVLLTNGYHAHIDIPSKAGGAVLAAPIGPDRRFAVVMAARLQAAGWRGEDVVLAAAGSADEQARDDARSAAADLSTELGVAVTTAFIGSGEPRFDVTEVKAKAVALYLIAPGQFADLAAASGAKVVAAPLGADPQIAEIILDRYDQALANVTPSLTIKADSGPPMALYVELGGG